MSRTVTAFGREWNHRQFYGLVKECVQYGFSINFHPDAGYVCELGDWTGRGDTLWLALCAAVEKMGETNDEG